MKTPTHTAARLLGLTLLASPAAPAQINVLSPGQTVDGVVTINGDPESASFVSYTFDVADDVKAFHVELEAHADLDLYLDTQYIEDYQDVLASSTSLSGSEFLQIDLSGIGAILSDEFHLDVTYGRIEPPLTAEGEPIRQVPYTLRLTTYADRIDGELEPGRIVSGGIDPDTSGPWRTYVVDVPRRAERLRVDLASDSTDLDLRIRYQEPMRTMNDADFTAVSWAGSESVVIGNDREGVPPGRYYIDVFDQAWLPWPAEFRLVATLGAAPPEGLLDLPRLATSGGLPGAIAATVEVLHHDGGGTGVILNESGYLLTNYHVVEHVITTGDESSLQIGLTVDPAEGSHVRLRARVVAWDADLDMALLAVTSDLYGNPLPADYRFPSIGLGAPDALAFGDALFAVGYPESGSLGTRVSITVTRGIVSGFERRGETLLIKTDADIASGNSGGPVINENHELIGLATETISEEFGNGQIGYIWPTWLVPREWWRLAGIDDPPAPNQARR